MLEIFLASLLFAMLGLLLGFASNRFQIQGNPLADALDSVLPQTQCGQCSYPGCRPYAEAIADNKADINQCPPGGENTVAALAELLGIDPKPLNAEYGIQKPEAIAFIVEEECIGCTLCVDACPVDAILGASKMMHTVIQTECTGCELCIEPCPVDCIVMKSSEETVDLWQGLKPIMPCIRCGDCVTVCPKNLLPQELYQQCCTGALDQEDEYNLMDCVECGLCNNVCPSEIPLVQYFNIGKKELNVKQQNRIKAKRSKLRYVNRLERLRQTENERKQSIQRKKQALKKTNALPLGVVRK